MRSFTSRAFLLLQFIQSFLLFGKMVVNYMSRWLHLVNEGSSFGMLLFCLFILFSQSLSSSLSEISMNSTWEVDYMSTFLFDLNRQTHGAFFLIHLPSVFCLLVFRFETVLCFICIKTFHRTPSHQRSTNGSAVFSPPILLRESRSSMFKWWGLTSAIYIYIYTEVIE